MKFRALPVTSLEDATVDFEQLQTSGVFKDTTLGGALAGTLPNPTLSTSSLQTFLQLLTPGTSRFTAGTSTATFTATSNTPAVNISHGLGAVPQRFWCESTNGFGAAFWMQVDAVGNWTSSVVKAAAFCYTNITATVTFQWFAIG